jgi:hypothetical protein
VLFSYIFTFTEQPDKIGLDLKITVRPIITILHPAVNARCRYQSFFLTSHVSKRLVESLYMVNMGYNTVFMGINGIVILK